MPPDDVLPDDVPAEADVPPETESAEGGRVKVRWPFVFVERDAS